MPFEMLRTGIEILVLFTGIYIILRFMEGTRGIGILKGLVIALLVLVLLLTGITEVLDSDRLELVRNSAIQYSILAILIIFHPELRRALVTIGQNPFIQSFMEEKASVVDELVKAVGRLSGARTGALIALEREIGLGTYIEGGTQLDAAVNVDLLCTIFHNGTPLHDGAVIIQGDRIASAGSLFPLTENPNIATHLGTRHRAGVGLSEETDAIVIIVSEETGRVSLAIRGHLMPDRTLESLREQLIEMYTRKERDD